MSVTVQVTLEAYLVSTDSTPRFCMADIRAEEEFQILSALHTIGFVGIQRLMTIEGSTTD